MIELTPAQERELSRAESDLKRALGKLGKNGAGQKADGDEISYARAYQRVVAIRQINEPGLMGIRRTRLMIGA